MSVDWSKVKEGTEVVIDDFRVYSFIFKRLAPNGGIILEVKRRGRYYSTLTWYPHEGFYKRFKPKREYLFEESI